jgi:hypothetical protein
MLADWQLSASGGYNAGCETRFTGFAVDGSVQTLRSSDRRVPLVRCCARPRLHRGSIAVECIFLHVPGGFSAP